MPSYVQFFYRNRAKATLIRIAIILVLYIMIFAIFGMALFNRGNY